MFGVKDHQPKLLESEACKQYLEIINDNDNNNNNNSFRVINMHIAISYFIMRQHNF